MKSIKKFNKKLIVSVQFVPKRHEDNFVFETRIKNAPLKTFNDYVSLFLGKRPKIELTSFFSDDYFWGSESRWVTYTKEELTSGRYFGVKYLIGEDNVVYRPPYVETIYVNKDIEVEKFDNEEDAIKFHSNQVNKMNSPWGS